MIEYRFCCMRATCNGKSAKNDSVICKPHAMNKMAKTGFCKVKSDMQFKESKA